MDEFLLFQHFIEQNCGIFIPVEKQYLIETRLSGILRETKTKSFIDLYYFMNEHPNDNIKQKIINAITTNETSWFRDILPWKMLEEIMLPLWISEIRSGKKEKIRIWSLAVASGQELFSTIICIDNYLRKHGIYDITLDHFEFLGTDISTKVLSVARKGRYNKFSIQRGLDPILRDLYFERKGDTWEILPNILKHARFEEFNLLSDFSKFGLFEAIFCRYILVYFRDELKKNVVHKCNLSLKEGGIFISGNYVLYEIFREEFTTEYYQNLTYFVKK